MDKLTITDEHIKLVHDWASVWKSAWKSVGESVEGEVWDEVWDKVWGEAWGEVWESVWASVGAYVSSLSHDYQPAVDLWRQGLVPSYDGKVWRLHVLWEGGECR